MLLSALIARLQNKLPLLSAAVGRDIEVGAALPLSAVGPYRQDALCIGHYPADAPPSDLPRACLLDNVPAQLPAGCSVYCVAGENC